MRRVDVSECPLQLKPESSPGAEEQAEAIEHYGTPGWEEKEPFKFKAYQHDQVRDALLDAFERVCAYCEAPTPSIEIEHYRPKGVVVTESGPRAPGYYWLAATWQNLLPSCHYCNTRLRTEYTDAERRSSGKGTFFPLLDESARATAPGGETEESPLLLHPYEDEPEKHLEFIEEGVVKPRADAAGVPSRRGEVTIELLGLNRRGLPEARRDRQVVLDLMHERALDAQRLYVRARNDEELAARYRRCVEDLEKLQHPSAGFAGMTAELIGLLDGPAATPRR